MSEEVMNVHKKRYYKLCFLMICFIVIAVMLTGCRIVEAASENAVVTSETKEDVKLAIQFRGERAKPEIAVVTNLPDKTQLQIRLLDSQKDCKIEKSIKVLSGQAQTNLLGILDEPLSPGEYSVTVEVKPETQQDSILAVIGEKGENLTGENVLMDTPKGEKYLCEQVDYTVAEKDFFDSNPTENAKTFYALEKAVQQEYGMNYRIAKETGNLIEITVWSDNSLSVYEQVSEDFDSNIGEWYEIRENLRAFTLKLGEIARFNMVEVNLAEQDDSQNPLLTVTGGDVSHDATQKGFPVRADNTRVDYIGAIGYIAVENYPDGDAYDPIGDRDFATTIWTVPTYRKDKQFYIKNGTIEHKTKVEVVSQNLIDKGTHYGNLYLTIKNIETGELSIIDSSNFIIVPYWKLDTEIAASIGKYVAEYHQVSDRWPEFDEKRVKVNEGEKVLALGTKWNKDGNKVTGFILQNGDWIKCEFDPSDLSIIY